VVPEKQKKKTNFVGKKVNAKKDLLFLLVLLFLKDLFRHPFHTKKVKKTPF
jgi:hypothetical protein